MNVIAQSVQTGLCCSYYCYTATDSRSSVLSDPAVTAVCIRLWCRKLRYSTTAEWIVYLLLWLSLCSSQIKDGLCYLSLSGTILCAVDIYAQQDVSCFTT